MIILIENPFASRVLRDWQQDWLCTAQHNINLQRIDQVRSNHFKGFTPIVNIKSISPYVMFNMIWFRKFDCTASPSKFDGDAVQSNFLEKHTYRFYLISHLSSLLMDVEVELSP